MLPPAFWIRNSALRVSTHVPEVTRTINVKPLTNRPNFRLGPSCRCGMPGDGLQDLMICTVFVLSTPVMINYVPSDSAHSTSEIGRAHKAVHMSPTMLPRDTRRPRGFVRGLRGRSRIMRQTVIDESPTYRRWMTEHVHGTGKKAPSTTTMQYWFDEIAD